MRLQAGYALAFDRVEDARFRSGVVCGGAEDCHFGWMVGSEF
jgi:hypothetical protein